MPSSVGSPVRRRRLAAELRRLRGERIGKEVVTGLGWSRSKISRYELGRSTPPIDEMEKLLDYYGVEGRKRGELLALARDANRRVWWDEYADALSEEYQEFIGLEAEAASVSQWQVEAVPGLLQTEDYARQVIAGYQSVETTITPSELERRVQVRMLRQRELTRDPPLALTAVIDESVLLRQIGGRNVMYTQLLHLAEVAELPNVIVRVLPLGNDRAIVADSFVLFSFGRDAETPILHDVVCTESIKSELYVEGETDTHLHRLVFESLARSARPPSESETLIRQTAERVWA